jgi:LytS/YehU family sensor histidine kinase
MEYRINNGVWVNADVHVPVSIASLSPGKYQLSARLKNDPAQGMVLHFTIAFPWWRKTWLQLLAAMLIISIMFFIIIRRANNIRREATLNQQLTESRMTALRSQMNPHFIFNILNSINSFIIENKTLIASNYLNDFSRLVRMVLEYSHKNLIPLSEELKALKLYLELESRRLENSFDYRIELESDIALSSFPVPPLLIQPFVENAIWHGLRNKKTPGKVEIKIARHENGLVILIADDGIGREEAKKLQPFRSDPPFGINATIQRVSLANPLSKITVEDLYDKDGAPAGTQVHIYLKISDHEK